MKNKFGPDLLWEQLQEFVRSEFECSAEETIGDSPIEKLLFHAIMCRVRFGATEYRQLEVMRTEEAEKSRKSRDDLESRLAILIRPQAILQHRHDAPLRRADFLVHALDWRTPSWTWRQLIVECDGHDFHERTKSQAARDRNKDRHAVLANVDQFRFTGSEIWRDPWGCADQILDWAATGWP